VNEYIYFGEAKNVHKFTVISSILIGTCLVILGIMGLYGIFSKKFLFLFIFNVCNILFLFITLSMGIIGVVYVMGTTGAGCEQTSWLK
jgi:hypothetical protein